MFHCIGCVVEARSPLWEDNGCHLIQNLLYITAILLQEFWYVLFFFFVKAAVVSSTDSALLSWNIVATALTTWFAVGPSTDWFGASFLKRGGYSFPRFFYSFFQLHLQSVPVHSANVVKPCTKTCGKVLTSTLLYLIGSESLWFRERVLQSKP
jgi:hypothetical protein